jgi:DNA-binding SARP family transcriptional activator
LLRDVDGPLRVEAPPGNRARINLLGGFELEVDGRSLRPPVHMQRLLAFLALQGRPLQRAYVAGCLWLDLSQERANGCLRTTLWRMSRLRFSLVQASSTHLTLDSSVTVDARELEACAERALHGDVPLADDDLERLARSRELMPDWYDDWVLAERERLRQLRLLALEAASEALIQSGRFADASITALAAVETDRLRESACRLLIRSYVGTGNVAEALHQVGVFCARLQREGLSPSVHMQELIRRIA